MRRPKGRRTIFYIHTFYVHTFFAQRREKSRDFEENPDVRRFAKRLCVRSFPLRRFLGAYTMIHAAHSPFLLKAPRRRKQGAFCQKRGFGKRLKNRNVHTFFAQRCEKSREVIFLLAQGKSHFSAAHPYLPTLWLTERVNARHANGVPLNMPRRGENRSGFPSNSRRFVLTA